MFEQKRLIRLLTKLALLIFGLCAVVYFIESNRDVNENKAKEYKTISGLVFGTTYHITYSSSSETDMGVVVGRALDAIDMSLSMFNPKSTMSMINKGELDNVSDSLFLKVWHAGCCVTRESNGAFDMTVAPLVDLWGFGLNNRGRVARYQVDSVLDCVGLSKISLNEHNVSKQSDCVRLDAGAIAKGFACDVVRDSLLAYGCHDVCVEIGGEVAVSGFNPKGGSWRIAINKPVDDSLSVVNEIYAVALLSNKGMATSGNYRNFYEVDGCKYSHTINPRTGYPVKHNLLSATVVAPDCMTADAWATACMVVGVDSAKIFAKEHSYLDMYLIYDSLGVMKVWYTPNFPLK